MMLLLLRTAHLNKLFSNRFIWQRDSIVWPVRSLSLTPLDFLLCRHLSLETTKLDQSSIVQKTTTLNLSNEYEVNLDNDFILVQLKLKYVIFNSFCLLLFCLMLIKKITISFLFIRDILHLEGFSTTCDTTYYVLFKILKMG